MKEEVEGGVTELRQRQRDHAAQLDDANSRALKDGDAMKARHKDEVRGGHDYRKVRCEVRESVLIMAIILFLQIS